MKKLFFLYLIFFWIIPLSAQNKNEPALANQYFKEGEYQKAAELFSKLFNTKNGEKLYYSSYFNTLLKLNDYESAKEVCLRAQKVMKDDLSIWIDYGYILKKSGDFKNAEIQFKKVIESLLPNNNEIVRLSGIFNNYGETDYAIEVYKKGKQLFNNPAMYNMDIARLYAAKRDISSMINSYLDELLFRSDQIKNVQSTLQRSLSEEAHFVELEKILYKRIQTNKSYVPYGEMLIWLYMHLGDYESAFVQARSMDLSYNEDGFRLMDLAKIALVEKYFSVAEKSYQYVIDKGPNGTYYVTATLELINTKKEKLLQEPDVKKEKLLDIKSAYNKFIKEYGKNNTTANATQELAKLYAFYFYQIDTAITLIEDLLLWPQVRPDILGQTKLQLGDYNLINEDHWEATLLYSQVEKEFKGTPVGEEAKFRNARLSYYKGDFEWAQTQLKFLKASTDQLISNDAIDLSVFISDNLNLDTTDHTMVLFTSAELLYFQNKFDDANIELEGIKLLYPGHKLTDDVYFLQAKIDIKRSKYENAIQKLTYITKYHEKELLADDAWFKMGEIYELSLKDKEKAMNGYQELIVNFSSSTFAVEAKKRYRILRGDEVN